MRRPRSWALLLLSAAFLQASVAKADDTQQEKSFEKEITIKVKLNYLLYLPEGYQTSDKPWPMILFLHGAGESGQDLSKVKMHGPPKLIAGGKAFPFIVVSPQSQGMGWNAEALNSLIDEVESKYRVDKDRVYLTGLSMGGGGTWALAAAHPERFAAIAPICGALRTSDGGKSMAVKIKDLPIWVFHGAKDPTVPIARSEEMVKALKELGSDVKFTVYPEAKHDSWTETYDNPELYSWFLSHKRSSK
jgi:predicted peptidase